VFLVINYPLIYVKIQTFKSVI